MPVTDDQVAALRAYLEGDFEGHKERFAELRRQGARDEFAALMPAAFAVAVERRFPPGTPIEKVVNFVGEVRARYIKEPDEVDPLVAERLIRVITDDASVKDISPDVKYRTQFLLLYPLIMEGGYSERGLTQFLAEARGIADEWLK